MQIFRAAQLLLPRPELLENWAVIACDQFTSDPSYWAEAERIRAAEAAAAAMNASAAPEQN